MQLLLEPQHHYNVSYDLNRPRVICTRCIRNPRHHFATVRRTARSISNTNIFWDTGNNWCVHSKMGSFHHMLQWFLSDTSNIWVTTLRWSKADFFYIAGWSQGTYISSSTKWAILHNKLSSLAGDAAKATEEIRIHVQSIWVLSTCNWMCGFVLCCADTTLESACRIIFY